MAAQAQINQYNRSINQVLFYIDTHLEENFDLQKLAEMANFSPFHFHRIIRSYLREPLWSYVIRQRLDTAARLLRYGDEPVSELIYKVGYDSPSSFSRAFKKKFGISPQEYREANQAEMNETMRLYTLNQEILPDMKSKFVHLESFKVVYIECNQGYKPEIIAPAWNKLLVFMKEKKLFGWNTRCIGISLDDPQITDPDRCRYQACFSVKKEIKPESEVGCKIIEGGRYVIFRHKGPYENFSQTYDYIYGPWLVESGCQLRDTPGFELYLNDPGKTKPENLKTDIYIPVV